MKTLKTNWLLKHTFTVFSCVMIIVFGIAFLSQADPVTTTIGENIVTNDLSVTGTGTIGGDLNISGNLNAKTGRAATFVIAANDSSTLSKQQADYVCDGIADEVQIQAAIDALPANGGKVLILEGEYTKSTTDGISIPSNTEIELVAGATIKFVDNINTDAQIFINENSDGNTNIIIHGGGILDGNRANQTTGEQAAIKITNVSKSTIDILMKNFRSYNVQEITSGVGNKIINREYPNLFIPETNVLSKLESHPLRKLIDDFETDWIEITGTLTYDTEIKHSGTRSAKLVAVGSVGLNGYARIEKEISPTTDESGMNYGIWVYAEDMSTLSGFKIYLRSGGNWAEYRRENIIYGVKERKFANNKWIFMGTKRFDYITAGFDVSAVDMIRIEITSSTNTTATVWIDKLIHASNSIAKNGMISIVFDDGNLSDYTKAKPLFDKYNFTACSAVTIDNIGTANHMNEAQLKELQQSGWDIIPHSVTHAYTKDGINIEDSSAIIEEEVLGSQDWAMQHGFKNGARFYVMPGGYYSEKYLDVIEKHFIAARGFGPYLNGESLPLLDPRILSCRSAGSGQTIEGIKLIIDEAFNKKRWLILVIHGVVDSGEPCDVAKLETLLEYVQSKNMPVVTFSQVFDNILFAPTQTIQYTELFMDVLAVSATHVRSDEDLSEAIPNTFTLDAQPDVPRTLSGHFDAHAQITAYSITVTGIDAKGNTVTEIKTEEDGWDWETSNAFATITSIIMTAKTGTGAGDTMDIGITDVLGLSNNTYSTSDVSKIKKNNANATVATAQVNTSYDTYDMSVIGLGAGNDFTIWYKSNLNIIN